MGNPLQEQLLKAGLVSKKQASKVNQEQYVQSKKKKKGKSVRKNARKPISQAEVARAAEVARNKQISRKQAEEMIDRLCEGQLGIVQLADSFEVVPAKVVRQVAERDKGAVISLREPSEEED
jgi:uncharacterized protein YaiL (DUF2058 family)